MEKTKTYKLEGKDYRVYPVTAPWGKVELIFKEESYLDGTLAVMAVEVGGEYPEDYAVVTVNLCDLRQDGERAFFDGNNSGYMFRQLCDFGLVKPLREYAASGFCRYQLCEWDKSKFLS